MPGKHRLPVLWLHAHFFLFVDGSPDPFPGAAQARDSQATYGVSSLQSLHETSCLPDLGPKSESPSVGGGIPEAQGL